MYPNRVFHDSVKEKIKIMINNHEGRRRESHNIFLCFRSQFPHPEWIAERIFFFTLCASFSLFLLNAKVVINNESNNGCGSYAVSAFRVSEYF